MKTLILLKLILVLATFQAAFATQERYDPQNPGDLRERRPAEDMRERRPAEDMRERRSAEDMRERRPTEDMRDRRPTEDMRDRRPAGDMIDRRPAGDMRERRPAEDMGERRSGSNQRSTDRPWRETLAKCREMKKVGKLSRGMKEECKAARELRKKSKQ